jgi:tetratricopeptide (TPR) repeat protein
MDNLAVDFTNFSTLFNSIHFTAFFLGGTLYLGYTMLPTLRLLFQPVIQGASSMMRTKESDPDQCSRPSKIERAKDLLRQITRRHLAGAGAVLAIVIGLSLSAHNVYVEKHRAACPAVTEGPFAPLPASQADRYYPEALDEDTATTPQAAAVPEAERWRAGAPGSEVEDSSLRLRLRSPGAWKYMRRTVANPAVVPPSELLAQAQNASDSAAAWPLLEACVAWSAEDASPLSELQAQLHCNGELVETSAITIDAAPTLLSRARKLMGALSGHKEEPGSTWSSAQAEWARITHGVFQLNCKAVTDELQTVRRMKASGTPQQVQQARAATSLAALGSLKRLETSFRETLTASAVGTKALQEASASAEELQELQTALAADRSCAVHALTEGRSVAMAIPRNTPVVQRAMQCHPRMLDEFKETVLREAAESNDAAILFALGLYYSDAGLAAGQGQQYAPFFEAGSQVLPSWLGRWTGKSEGDWSADAGGTHGPSDLVNAEKHMLASEEASEGQERSDRGAARALRLYQHAKMLALKHHDSAAEWRYRAAADLAAVHRREKLAAHTLGRLGYFLSLRGRKEEALTAVNDALNVSESVEKEPLAQYLQVSLKRSLGEIKSEEMQVVESQLSDVAGKLPSKTLEDARAAAHTELEWWRLVATEGLHICLQAWDAAQMLICALMGLAFSVPGYGPAEGV